MAHIACRARVFRGSPGSRVRDCTAQCWRTIRDDLSWTNPSFLPSQSTWPNALTTWSRWVLPRGNTLVRHPSHYDPFADRGADAKPAASHMGGDLGENRRARWVRAPRNPNDEHRGVTGSSSSPSWPYGRRFRSRPRARCIRPPQGASVTPPAISTAWASTSAPAISLNSKYKLSTVAKPYLTLGMARRAPPASRTRLWFSACTTRRT